MAQTRFDICSRALQRVGADSIASFDDGTTESDVAGREYPPLVETLLSEYRWRFATKDAELNHLTEAPLVGYDEYWQLPSDLLDLHGVFLADETTIQYERRQDRIACDYDETSRLFCTYTASFAESFWPAYFVEVVTEALEVVFAQAIARDIKIAESKRKHLDTVTKPMARSRDSQQQTSRQFPASRLVAIRST